MKFRLIADPRETFPVRVLCDVMGVSPAGYSAGRGRPESLRETANRALLSEIRRVQMAHRGRYGAPRIYAALRTRGYMVSRGRGGADCHMCGRCDGFRGAISLAPRSPNHEIVHVAGAAPKPWESVLIVFGLMGIAIGAFHWSVSPWFVALKQALAGWLVDHHVLWPLRQQPPWWVLTDYPSVNDQMTVLDGGVLLAYVMATAIAIGASVSLCLWLAARSLGPSPGPRFHHLAQSLIPVAACGVFLGLSAITVTMLRAEGFALGFVGPLRALLLGGAAVWSIVLAWKIAGLNINSRRQEPIGASDVMAGLDPAIQTQKAGVWMPGSRPGMTAGVTNNESSYNTGQILRRFAATVCVALAVSTGAVSWVVFFWVWQ